MGLDEICEIFLFPTADILNMGKSKPKIVVVIGAPSAGKTKLGRAIARELRMAVSDKDHVTGQLLASLLKDAGFEGEDYSQTDFNRFRTAIYGCMEDVAKDNLRAGMGTVIISPYVDRGAENWLDELKSRVDVDSEADWSIIWINITPDLALERIVKRNSPRDVFKLSNWDSFEGKTYWGPPSCKHLELDASKSIEDRIRKAVRYVKKAK